MIWLHKIAYLHMCFLSVFYRSLRLAWTPALEKCTAGTVQAERTWTWSVRQGGPCQSPCTCCREPVLLCRASVHGPRCLLPQPTACKALLSCQPWELTFFVVFAWAFRKGPWRGTWGKSSRADPEEGRSKQATKPKDCAPNPNPEWTKQVKRGTKLWGAMEMSLVCWFKRIIWRKLFLIHLRATSEPWLELENYIQCLFIQFLKSTNSLYNFWNRH